MYAKEEEEEDDKYRFQLLKSYHETETYQWEEIPFPLHKVPRGLSAAKSLSKKTLHKFAHL